MLKLLERLSSVGLLQDPTEFTNIVVINKQNVEERFYVQLTKGQIKRIYSDEQISEFFHLVSCAFYKRLPISTPNMQCDGYIVGTFGVAKPYTNPIIVKAAIPYNGAYRNGGDWKKRTCNNLALIGELPDGILFDYKLLIHDVQRFIQRIDQ